jgi:hypothetical protein
MKLVICLALVFSLSPVGLIGQLMNISYQPNLDVYKPYTSLAQEYINKNSKVSSFTQSVLVSYPILRLNKNTVRIGLNYKKIEHTVKDRILEIPTYKIVNHQSVFVGNVPSKRDLISKSNLYGLHLDYNRVLLDKKFYKGSYGATSELYLFEFYESYYYRSEIDKSVTPYIEEKDASILPLIPKERNIMKPVLSTISLYFLNTFQCNQHFSLGLRVSAGTNLYSKWDQFSRYAWVGLGLELGFGTSKAMM